MENPDPSLIFFQFSSPLPSSLWSLGSHQIRVESLFLTQDVYSKDKVRDHSWNQQLLPFSPCICWGGRGWEAMEKKLWPAFQFQAQRMEPGCQRAQSCLYTRQDKPTNSEYGSEGNQSARDSAQGVASIPLQTNTIINSTPLQVGQPWWDAYLMKAGLGRRRGLIFRWRIARKKEGL